MFEGLSIPGMRHDGCLGSPHLRAHTWATGLVLRVEERRKADTQETKTKPWASAMTLALANTGLALLLR